jgi:hypothetical protein
MSRNTIILEGLPIEKYLVANASITPGHLIERMSTNKVRVHASAGGHAQKMFAIEDDLQGNDINDAYTATAQVRCGIFGRGSVVNALIGNGQNIAIGDPLESAGTGELRKYTHDSAGLDTTNNIVAYALEAVDMSDSSAADPAGRCAVEIA